MKSCWRSIVALLIVYILSAPTQALEPIEINYESQFVNLNEHIESLRTPRRSQLSQVQTMTNWQRVSDPAPLAQGQALWYRLAVDYLSGQEQHFTFIVDNPNIDFLDVYLLDDKNRILEAFLVGAKRDINERPFNHRSFVLPVSLAQNASYKVYFRIRDDGPSVHSLALWQNRALIQKEQMHLAFIGVIGGSLAILFCYFLVTYVVLRSPIRFWFSLANAGLLALFLSIQGIISQITGLGAYMAQANSIIIAIIVFCASKVAHSMLAKVPVVLRFVSYLLAIGLVIIAPLFNSYWQIVLSSILAGTAVLLQFVLALIYHDRKYRVPYQIYTLGWLIVCAIAIFNVSVYLSANAVSNRIDLLLSFIMMSGVLLIAVAIESHAQAVIRVRQSQQQGVISDLHKFYDLFKNSVEGLYTSTMQGKLVTTNPAMCLLFGYEDETQMLAEVKDTSQLYANPSQRDELLDEIQTEKMILGREVKGIRRDGSEFWFCLSVQLTHNDNEDIFFGSIFDVTEKKQSSISLEYLATHDSLTGVYNRREFEQSLRSGIRRCKQIRQALSVMYMDLDQFKIVNDTCGHKAGDILIKQLSQSLNDVVAGKGLLARLGGDEFGVILEEEHAGDADEIAQELLGIVRDFRFVWDDRIFVMGISIGIARWKPNVETTEQLLSMADAACYIAKELGRNQIHTYSSNDQKMQRYETELKWVSQINHALENNRFVLFYQHYLPLKSMPSGHYYEILIRMLDENGSIVPPSAFLPAAERYAMSGEIDKWVVENTFKWLSGNTPHLAQLARCNINLSGHSLSDKEMQRHVMQAFEQYEIPYDKICFEITESMAIVKIDETMRFINTFKKLGCTFALDDFGSGFSSYSYLKNLPVNCLKIDGSFVKDLLIDPIDMAMVCSMKDVANAMSMTTVAEFVESKDVMIALGKIGVDFAQGYGVAKPAPLTEFSPCGMID